MQPFRISIKKALTAPLLLLLPLLLTAQGFERTYGGPGIERALAVLPASNGDVVMAGNRVAPGDTLPDLLFLRVDGGGNLLAEKITGQAGRFESANVLLPAADGGFLLAGEEGATLTGFHRPLLVKTDPGGTVEWTAVSTLDSVVLSAGAATPDGGWVAGGLKFIDGGLAKAAFFIKIDAAGQVVWTTVTVLAADLDRSFDVVALPDGNVWAAGVLDAAGTGDRDIFLLKINASGICTDTVILAAPGLQWQPSLALTAGGDLLLAGNELNGTGGFDFWFARLYMDGTLDQKWSGDTGKDEVVYALQARPGGGFLLAGEIRPAAGQARDAFLWGTDSNGSPAFWRSYGGVQGDFFTGMTVLPSGGLALAGQTTSFGDGSVQAYFVRTDSLGRAVTNHITGYVRVDQDSDCEADHAETALPHWLVQAEKGADRHYALTDSAGYYDLNVDTGAWHVTVIPPGGYWTPCHDSVEVFFDTLFTTNALDFAVQPGIQCPLLDVDFGTPFLRRCFNNTFTLRYFNFGTRTAEQASVAIVLDPFLSIQSATLPWQTVGDTLLFSIGDVKALSGGTFNLTAYLDCDSTVTGQTHCSSAFAFPDSSCYAIDPVWDMSNVAVSGYCAGDSVVLRISNVGIGDMSGPVSFVITEDLIIIRDEPLQLAAGQDTTFVIYPEGHTVLLRIEQTAGNPYSESSTLAIEGCGGAIEQYGLPLIYPIDDATPWTDTDCRMSIASFDPNEKLAFPTGVGEAEHGIPPDTGLEYELHFQNTGTDTAFRVEVRDTLAAFLDPATVVAGASSHPYRLEYSGEGALHFIFENILLPASGVNWPASNGFVRFRVSPRPALPLETRIENRAGIYFDFNLPVITNTVWHTVREINELLQVGISAEPQPEAGFLHVSPNPVGTQAAIAWSFPNGRADTLYRLELTDLTGRRVWHCFSGPAYTVFERGQLPAGVYFLRVFASNFQSLSAKILIP